MLAPNLAGIVSHGLCQTAASVFWKEIDKTNIKKQVRR